MPDKLNFLDKLTMTLVRRVASSRCKERILDLLVPSHEKVVLDFLKEGYLVDVGWFNAEARKESVGKANEPIPWITYPAIEFLSARLRPEMDVFEFGAGNSTLYYAARVASVTAVEHDAGWYAKLSSRIPNNVTLIYKELEYDGHYCRTVQEKGDRFDIVVVDGRDRVNCLIQSISALKDGGVVILDDSGRAEYKAGREFMAGSGFNFIDFVGFAPGYFFTSSTTVFYRDLNCLGI